MVRIRNQAQLSQNGNNSIVSFSYKNDLMPVIISQGNNSIVSFSYKNDIMPVIM